MRLSVRGFALSAAVLWGSAILLLGLANLAVPAYGAAFLQAIGSVYPGFHASRTLGDVLVGTVYALLYGGVAGLIFAIIYNRVGKS